MWAELRTLRNQGFHIRRQVPFGPYIADFACHSARILIEVDGGVHVLTVERDAQRDAWLTRAGFPILRFDNDAIIQDRELTFLTIKRHLQKHR